MLTTHQILKLSAYTKYLHNILTTYTIFVIKKLTKAKIKNLNIVIIYLRLLNMYLKRNTKE